MALLRLGFILLTLSSAGAAEPDPFAAMARKLSIAARAKGFKSLVVMPFEPIATADEAGPRLLTERLASRLSSGEGFDVLDGRQLRAGGGSARRAPDDSDGFDAAFDLKLLDGMTRVLRLIDMPVEDTPREAEIRALLAEKIKERRLAALRRRELEIARGEGRSPEADGLVSGVVAELSDGSIELHARLADAHEQTIVATASVRVKKDWGRLPSAERPEYGGLAGLGGGAVLAFLLFKRLLTA